MSAAAMATVIEAVIVGWLALAVTGASLSRYIIRGHRSRLVLWTYLLLCGLIATWGSVIGTQYQVEHGVPVQGVTDVLPHFFAYAVAWPIAVLWALLLVLSGRR